MTTSEQQPAQATGRRTHRRLLAAGLIGSSIEWYDFFLYGTAAALVFPQVFFPGSSALTGALLSFSTFWAGFLARPIGGVAAGHFGDRYGRKPVVVTSLLVMGTATFLVGCLPGTRAIGVTAPILLVLLRFAQGLACGGQWGGIVLLLTESAGPGRRGLFGTFGQLGVPFGVLLGNIAFFGIALSVDRAVFLDWGWRIPFLASILLFPLALYIQKRIEDSPEFQALRAAAATRRPQDTKETKDSESIDDAVVVQAPLGRAIRHHWRVILLGAGLLAATNCLFYIGVAGILNYGTEQLGMEYGDLLAVSMLATLVGAVVIVWSGRLSDRIGRRPLILFGAAAIVLWAFPYFWLVDTASLSMAFIAITVASVFQSMTYGPLAAYLSELFAPNVRYSGATLAYQLAAITVGGGTPFIMTALIARTGSTLPVSAFIALMGLITVLSVWRLPESNPRGRYN